MQGRTHVITEIECLALQSTELLLDEPLRDLLWVDDLIDQVPFRQRVVQDLERGMVQGRSKVERFANAMLAVSRVVMPWLMRPGGGEGGEEGE